MSGSDEAVFNRNRQGFLVMDCRQAQTFLALVVGQDHADARAEGAVSEHVEHCAVCQSFQRQLRVSQSALVEARLVPDSRRRLWPRVAERLAGLTCRPQFARFNIWVPTTIAAAACLLLVAVASQELQYRSDGYLSSAFSRQPEPRDLFQTDPEFAANRGELPSAVDLHRWRDRHSPDAGSGELLPAMNRPRR